MDNILKLKLELLLKKIGLEVFRKKDSQEICFIPDNNHGSYIERFSGREVVPGNFVDKDGKVLGKHKGIVYYTIGQRKGLGIALGRPVFVTNIIPERNEVVLGEESEIFNTTLIAKNINLIPFDRVEGEIMVEAKVRYSAKPAVAKLTQLDEDHIKLEFETPQRAITKGQSVVCYQGNLVIGGGIIDKVIK